jgi:hypothetical protein
LFSGDYFHGEKLNFTERHNIVKTQEKLVLMIQRYLYARYPKNVAVIGFARAMESLVDLRELSDIMSKLQINETISNNNQRELNQTIDLKQIIHEEL